MNLKNALGNTAHPKRCTSWCIPAWTFWTQVQKRFSNAWMPGSAHGFFQWSAVGLLLFSFILLLELPDFANLHLYQPSHRISSMHCSIAQTVYLHFGCPRYQTQHCDYCHAFAADLQSILSSDLKCWIPWQRCHWTRTICHSFETVYFSLWCSCNNVLRLLSLNGRAHQPAGTHTCH